jgi:tetratricopeptide (TPR) repeat protein
MVIKALVSLFAISLLCGCGPQPKPYNEWLKELQDNVSAEGKLDKEKYLAWERIVDGLYKLAQTDKQAALKGADDLMKGDSAVDHSKRFDLYFIRGEIFYELDSSAKAIAAFSDAEQELGGNSPKCLAARAGAYIQLKQYSYAFNDLGKATSINPDYEWNVGNYYEIIGKLDSAVANYDRLYLKDTVVYNYCKFRINKLKDDPGNVMKRLIFMDRKRTAILFTGRS